MTKDGRPVFKYNLKGQLIDSYESIQQAAKTVMMSSASFKRLVKKNSFVAGYIFSFDGDGIPVSDEGHDFSKKMPWEKNGYFDINGWSKSCLY